VVCTRPGGESVKGEIRYASLRNMTARIEEFGVFSKVLLRGIVNEAYNAGVILDTD